MKRFVCLFSIAAALTVVPSASAATDALVSVGSPTGAHPQNASNEPALAVDPVHPNILAAGSNDLVDMQPCSQQASTTAGACSFPLGTFNLGVGLTGDYFSFDSGHTWVQPTYQGLTAATATPPSSRATPMWDRSTRSRTTTRMGCGHAAIPASRSALLPVRTGSRGRTGSGCTSPASRRA